MYIHATQYNGHNYLLTNKECKLIKGKYQSKNATYITFRSINFKGRVTNPTTKQFGEEESDRRKTRRKQK